MLRKPTHFRESPDSKSCVYLENGACTVCDCDECGSDGFFIDEWRARQRAGDVTCSPRRCSCVTRAINRKHLRDSGLEKLAARCTIESYLTDTPWRKAVKDKALAYLSDYRNSSFFIGGQSGSGKTHICTAICAEIMGQGNKLRYFQWAKDGLRLKQIIGDREQYDTELRKWASVPFLYIDDLFNASLPMQTSVCFTKS